MGKRDLAKSEQEIKKWKRLDYDSFDSPLSKYFLKKYGMQLDKRFAIGMMGLIDFSGITTKKDLKKAELVFAEKYMEPPTFREEANVIIAKCVRNGILEEYHGDGVSIDNPRMKALMIESTKKLAEWLKLKKLLEDGGDQVLYYILIKEYERFYTSHWEK